MAAETTGAGTPVTGATPGAGATPAETAPAETTPATGAASPEGSTPEAQLGEAGARLLAEARKAVKDAERRAKEVEAKLREREEADLTESQRTAKRLADLEAEKATWATERRTVYLTAAVSQLSARLGLVDADAVVRLLDPASVEYDDSGQPVNTEAVVTALVRSKPYLAGAARPPQAPVGIGATEGTTAAPAPNLTAAELEAARLTGMTPERYAALKGVKTVDEWQATRRGGQH